KEVDVDFTDLINQLKDTDTVIFVGGLSSMLEGEEMPVLYPGFRGGDRTDIELPEAQRNLLKALKAAGKKVIFVNCSGSAIALTPETESCDAILQAWYGGESGGQGVADVLFGDYNPSGKLPVTFYRSTQQLPGFEDYSMKGRTYRFMSDPLFQFGFGLSYTSFSIGNAQISKTRIKSGEDLKLSVPVSNTGRRDGTEVVQVYIRKINDRNGPLKTLRGFQRVNVISGKRSTATIDLPYKAFEFYDESKLKMAVTPGEYQVWYGNSSASKDLKMIKVNITQ
ncbi:MAG TPA: glycoside hydrolase family 3 C-terminal domain-containing protein, partial [Pyrinomonadaceae bacterium]|nr:glycoside hydrolase family 3 C-terminal domain-containing protein [Pyrinomonadaceae bacterium]